MKIHLQILINEDPHNRWLAIADSDDGSPMFDGTGASSTTALYALAQSMGDYIEKKSGDYTKKKSTGGAVDLRQP